MKQKIIILITTLLLLPVLGNAQGVQVDKLPKVSSIAIHQGQVEQYFAATSGGVYSSNNGGLSWTLSSDGQLPATMVSEPVKGTLYAFIVGKGLLRLDDSSNQWQLVNNQFGSQVLVELSAKPGNPTKLVAVNQFGKMVVSEDSGANWHSIKGAYNPTTEAQKRGLALYNQICASCHGIDGVGETYTLQALTDNKYLRAPAMNDSEHAWHHTDEAIIKTILEGSPREPRMIAWKNAGITEQKAKDLIAYIKSLWTQRELDCQGPKHMDCM